MNAAARLPLPGLSYSRFLLEAGNEPASSMMLSIELLTDQDLFEACGVRIAFTGRNGGVSTGVFTSLNLASHVSDDLACVHQNRQRLMAVLGCTHAHLVVPNQVHGARIVQIDDPTHVQAVQKDADAGSDGLAVFCSDVAALLCFADCMPVIIVSPTGDFVVVHAGWRGVYAHIATSALSLLCGRCACDACECNAYLGPFIHSECFEVGQDLAEKFYAEFGSDCIVNRNHVDLAKAIVGDLVAAGIDPLRIANSEICTVCNADRYFSYRASGGQCGRHGAIAVRLS